MKSLLISVRSDLARKVISGEKLWEMRKSAPKTTPDYLIVYSKKPDGAVIGYRKILRVSQFYCPFSSTTEVYVVNNDYRMKLDEFLSRVCITEGEFRKYFGINSPSIWIQAYVIEFASLSDPVAIEPVKLPFHPPQGWRYFEGHPEEVIKGWKTCSSRLETILAPSATYKRLEQNETINS